MTRLGLRVAAVSDRPDYPYRYRVIDDREVNAFALPGGPVYVTSGMMSFIGNDQGQLAGVLGHETAHVARRHAAEQIQRQSWLGLGISILTGGNSTLQAAATLAANLEELGFSRNQERDADTYGAVYMTRANMDPQGEVRLLQRLAAQGGGGGIAFLRTHPSGSERVTRLQGQLQGGEIRRLAGQ